MDLRDRRDLYNGFGDGLARAFEFAATPAIFGFFGWLIDRWVGTTPLFMLTLAAVCLVGMFLRMWYAYDQEMRRHEAKFAQLAQSRSAKAASFRSGVTK